MRRREWIIVLGSLIREIRQLEADNRDLRGQLEEAHNQASRLAAQLDQADEDDAADNQAAFDACDDPDCEYHTGERLRIAHAEAGCPICAICGLVPGTLCEWTSGN